MTGYCVSDIAKITGGTLHGSGDAPVTGAVIDSRAVTAGCLFAAIPGERVDGLGYYGMPVIYYMARFEDPQYPGHYLDTDYVELTLVPVGPLIDGSAGHTLRGFGERTGDGPAIVDVPLGRYTISGRYLSPNHPPRSLLLRLRNRGEYVPALTADFAELLPTRYQIELEVDIDTAAVFATGFESVAGVP